MHITDFNSLWFICNCNCYFIRTRQWHCFRFVLHDRVEAMIYHDSECPNRSWEWWETRRDDLGPDPHPLDRWVVWKYHDMKVIIWGHNGHHYGKDLDDMMMARVFRWYDYHVKACKVFFFILVGQENMLILNVQALLRLLSYLTIFWGFSEHENGPDEKSLV